MVVLVSRVFIGALAFATTKSVQEFNAKMPKKASKDAITDNSGDTMVLCHRN